MALTLSGPDYRDLTDWKFSFSQLETFTQCSLKYQLLRLKKDRPQRNPAAWLVHGNALHAMDERWHLEGNQSDPHELYDEEWDKELARQLEVQPDLSKWELTPRVKKVETDLELRQKAGHDQVDALVKEFEKGEWELYEIYEDDIPVPAVETPFELVFAGVAVRGKVDHVRVIKSTGELEIVDLKTGSAKQYDRRQLGLYALAMSEVYNVKITWGRNWYSKLDTVPRSGDKGGRYSSYVDLSHFNREYWENEFGLMVRAINNEIFLPSPSDDNCGRCEAAPVCRIKPVGY